MWKKPLWGQERLCLIFLSCLCFVIFLFSFSASCLLVLCPEVGEGPAGEEGQSPEPFLHGNAVLEPTAAAGCYGGFCGRLGSHLHRLTKGALGSRTRGCVLWESARREAVGGSTKPPSSLGNALAVLPAPEGPRHVPGGQGCHPRLTPVPWPPDDHRAGGPRRPESQGDRCPTWTWGSGREIEGGPPAFLPPSPQPALRPGLISRPAAAGAACNLSAGTPSAQPWARAQRRADSLRLPGPWPVGVGCVGLARHRCLAPPPRRQASCPDPTSCRAVTKLPKHWSPQFPHL